MLGEFFYNFGWLGIVGSFLVGALLAWCQSCLNEAEDVKCNIYTWVSAVLAVFLLLFIRGYFTDAIMKLAYVYLFIWLTSCLRKYGSRHRSFNCDGNPEEADAK